MSSTSASTAASFANRDPASRSPSSVRPTGQVNPLPSVSTLPQVQAAESGAATPDLTSLNQALTQLNATVQAILNRLNGAG